MTASANVLVQQRLAPLEGRIGPGWPQKPKPTRKWPKLPACGASPGGTAGADSSVYTWDSNKTLTSITTALYMIPSPVGSLFAGMVYIMWPPDEPVDVTEIVDQEILNYALAQADADVSAIEEENRQDWQPALHVWLPECGWTEKSPPDWQPPPGCGSTSARLRVATAWDDMFADLV